MRPLGGRNPSDDCENKRPGNRPFVLSAPSTEFPEVSPALRRPHRPDSRAPVCAILSGPALVTSAARRAA